MENQPVSPNFDYATAQKQAVVTVGDWIVTFILMVLPIVNIIMLFVWAFGGSTPVSKANWAKATLIVYLIIFILTAVFWGTIGATIAGMGRF